MAGKLDEISAAIGELRSDVRAFGRELRTNRDLADERHKENSARLDAIGDRVGGLETTVATIAPAVTAMKPLVDDYRDNRTKAIGILFAISAIFSVFGYFAADVKALIAGLFFGRH